MLAEHALSLDRFYDEEEEGYVYTLQPQFVKGYFNRNTNEGYLNPLFNPSYDNPELAKLNAGRFLDF